MTEKRFTFDSEFEMGIYDRKTNKSYDGRIGHQKRLCELLEGLYEENKELKQHIKGLEKEIYLQHMRSMFSTVKSFKGDVSKRYYYSEETDTLYDTANHYGQYNKILDKKEIAMLLNEYETLLNGGDLND